MRLLGTPAAQHLRPHARPSTARSGLGASQRDGGSGVLVFVLSPTGTAATASRPEAGNACAHWGGCVTGQAKGGERKAALQCWAWTRRDDGAPRGRRIGAHRDGAAKGQLSGQTRPAATPRGQAAAAPVTGVADLGRLGPNRPTGRHAGPLTGRLISLQFKNFIFTRSRLFNSAYLYLRPLFCFSL